MTTTTDPAAVIAWHVARALEDTTPATPAEEPADQRAEAQARFDTVGLPRGLRATA